jgi:hypothetical protein
MRPQEVDPVMTTRRFGVPAALVSPASLTAEEAARTAADATIAGTVTAEAVARAAADSSLSTSLAVEVTNRGNAVSAEATARAAADALLATIASVTPGAWLTFTMETGAGDPAFFSPGTPAIAAGRVESTVSGVVRLRGAIGITGAGFAQSVKVCTLPAALRPAITRQGVLRTRGVTSTHTIWTVDVDGSFALQTTAIAASSCIFLDGITYTL